MFCWDGFALVERHLNPPGWRWVSAATLQQQEHSNHNISNSFLMFAGDSACPLITGFTFSNLFLYKPCGESTAFLIRHVCFSVYTSAALKQFSLPCLSELTCRSALQSLHKACEVARCQNYFPGSLFLTWVSYYQSRVSSDQARINEWNAMQDVQSHRADSPVLFSDV